MAVELQAKPDFARTLERFEAWWQCEIVDRPPVCIGVKSPHNRRHAPPKTYASIRERWWDIDHILDQLQAAVEDTTYFADSFPLYFPNLGPDLVSTLFGCELEFAEVTSWSKPVAGSCRDILNLPLRLDSPYWSWMRRAIALSLQRGAGKWITTMPDLHTNGDVLLALRGPQELCLELIDDPAAVRAACDHVTTFYPAIFDDLWRPIEANGQPCLNWVPAPHAGRSYVTSCDFICMISTDMFERAILPSIRREMEFLERNIFHLDGPGALKHLDALLAEPKLTGLQWVAGEGHAPAAMDWIDVYKKAQAAGKCIQLCAANIDDAKQVAQHLRPRGVWFCIGQGYSLEEAQAFLDWTGRWAAGKSL